MDIDGLMAAAAETRRRLEQEGAITPSGIPATSAATPPHRKARLG